MRAPRVTPSFVVSVVALGVALSGSAYAAGVLPKHSVGALQIKAGAVTSAKVRDGSLAAKDFQKGALPAAVAGPKGDQGAQGPKGDPGAKGEKGEKGDAGTAVGWVTVSSDGTIYSRGGELAAPTITHPSTGLYCITGTGWVQQGGPYSVVPINSGQGAQATVNPYFWGSGCNAAGYNITVSVFNASGTLANSYFMLAKLG